MYTYFDYQSSHEGYIDFYMQELMDKPSINSDPSVVAGQNIILDPDELFGLVCDGYIYCDDFLKIPEDIERVFENCGDYKASGVSKRRVKSWCKNVIKQWSKIMPQDEYDVLVKNQLLEDEMWAAWHFGKFCWLDENLRF